MNGAYQVDVPRSVQKAIGGLPKNRQQQVQNRIDSLSENPRPSGCTKLSGYDVLYRIRVGDYRIVYEIHDNHRIVIILIVAHRRESYRGL